MTDPDKELEDYLAGKAPLSSAYREASRETPPERLDDAILAHARAEARKKPSWSRALAPLALAATVVLGVNLAWNLYEAGPVPTGDGKSAPPTVPAESKAPAAASARPLADQARPDVPGERGGAEADAVAGLTAPSAAESGEAPAATGGLERREAAAPAAARSKSAPSETQRIERLIAWVGSLDGVQFLVDGESFTPPQAAVYLRVQWKEAQGRVHTVEDFIVKCATRSPATGKAYVLRYENGDERALSDVLGQRIKETR